MDSVRYAPIGEGSSGDLWGGRPRIAALRLAAHGSVAIVLKLRDVVPISGAARGLTFCLEIAPYGLNHSHFDSKPQRQFEAHVRLRGRFAGFIRHGLPEPKHLRDAPNHSGGQGRSHICGRGRASQLRDHRDGPAECRADRPKRRNHCRRELQ